MNKLMTMFRTPTAQELAQRELAEAERQLLEAQTAMEYAKAAVTYNQDRIRRLRGLLADRRLKGTEYRDSEVAA